MVNKNQHIEIWEQWFDTRDGEVKNDLIINYIWLVKFVLSKMNLPTNSLLSETDFLGIGVLGLHETIERYNLERGVKFESYAIPRIKGIIKDELRKLDWLSRNTRKKAQEYLNATEELQTQEGREVTQEEIRQKLDVNPDTYNRYIKAAAAARASISFSENKHITLEGDEIDILETIPDPEENDYLSDLVDKERIQFLADYIVKLDRKPRLVMSLYYYEELTFKEIGKTLELTESRVCQIHTKVIKELRKTLFKLENA